MEAERSNRILAKHSGAILKAHSEALERIPRALVLLDHQPFGTGLVAGAQNFGPVEVAFS